MSSIYSISSIVQPQYLKDYEFYHLLKFGVELKQFINGIQKVCVLYIHNHQICIGKRKNPSTSIRIDLDKLVVYPLSDNILVLTTIPTPDNETPPPQYPVYTTKPYIRDYIVKSLNQMIG